MKTPTKEITARLKYLKGEIQAERISYGEIAELVRLKDYIDRGDVELLEWAGVPEFEELESQSPTFFIPKEIPNPYPHTIVRGEKAYTLTIEDSGLDSKCEGETGQHEWLYLPFAQDQKQYLYCMKCGDVSHLTF